MNIEVTEYFYILLSQIEFDYLCRCLSLIFTILSPLNTYCSSVSVHEIFYFVSMYTVAYLSSL